MLERDSVGILGGGIAGLTCAYYLARAGYKPVVFEPTSELGGFGMQLDHEGVLLDRVPHSIQSRDTAVCGLLAELGALGRLTWRRADRGVVSNDQLYPLGGVVNSLRVTGPGILEHIRARAGIIYATRFMRYTLHLNEIRAVEWLPKIFGRAFFEGRWRPYLEARYGEFADEVPALVAWREIQRIHGRKRPMAGYIRGGPRWLPDALRGCIEKWGGEVRLEAQITRVELNDRGGCTVEIEDETHHFSKLISTLKPAQLRRIASGELASQVAKMELPQLGQVVATAILSRRLSRYHQTYVPDADAPFSMIEEATAVIPARQSGGKHFVYLTRSCDATSPAFELPDDVVRKQVAEALSSYYPDFDPESIEAVHVTRIAETEPMHTVDQARDMAKATDQKGPFFFCTAAEAYPRAPGWDAEITLAREFAAKVS